jgi:hypothetical protein
MTLRLDSGRIQTEYFTNTDVTLAYCLMQSTGGLTFATAKEDCYLTDLTLSVVALGDTKSLKLFIDGTDTGIRWTQSASWPTVNNRQFNMNPVRIRKGQQIQIQAIT